MLTNSKLKRWSINYYIDTAQAAETAARDLARPGGGLGGVLLRTRKPYPGVVVGRQHRHRPATPTPSPGWSVSPILARRVRRRP